MDLQLPNGVSVDLQQVGGEWQARALNAVGIGSSQVEALDDLSYSVPEQTAHALQRVCSDFELHAWSFQPGQAMFRQGQRVVTVILAGGTFDVEVRDPWSDPGCTYTHIPVSVFTRLLQEV